MYQLYHVPEVPVTEYAVISLCVLNTVYLSIYWNFVYLQNFVFNTLY